MPGTGRDCCGEWSLRSEAAAWVVVGVDSIVVGGGGGGGGGGVKWMVRWAHL